MLKKQVIKMCAVICIITLLVNVFIPIAFATNYVEESVNDIDNENISQNETAENKKIKEYNEIQENETEENINDKIQDNEIEENIIDENKESKIDDDEIEESEKYLRNYEEENEILNEKTYDIILNSEEENTLLNENSTSIIENMQNDIEQEQKEIESNPQEDDKIIEQEFNLYTDVNGYIVKPFIKTDTYYLFLPQGENNLDDLKIYYTGNVTEISAGTINNDNTITCNFTEDDTIVIIANGNEYTLKVLKSDLPSMTISLNNTNLEEINNGSKETKYGGNNLSLKTGYNNNYDFEASDVEIKGRGNYTWNLPKKPYQIKLNKKQSILGMKKAKTWILLANYMDNSFARNKVAFDLARDLGLDYTPDYKFIDLWIDGEYLGNYMITEKVQVNSNRVDLSDINGIIAELDNHYYENETTWFKSDISNTFFTLKDSVADDESENNSISRQAFYKFEEHIKEFESVLYSEDKDWEKISSMIDVETFIKYYFVQELSEDPDGCRTSIFMYKDGNEDIIHMGPVWDYDSAFGNYTEERFGGNPNIDYVINIQKYMEYSNDWYNKLFQIKEFREEVSKLYNQEIKQILENIEEQKQLNMEKSVNMNNIIWDTFGKESLFGRINEKNYSDECKYLDKWIQNRIHYLNQRYQEDSNIYDLKYNVHIQDLGWLDYSKSGEIAGTKGENRRLEALKINLDTFNNKMLENIKIKYQVHIQDYGWQDWKEEGRIAGTEGESKSIDAVKITLEDTHTYSIQYKVNIQDSGWTDWMQNGELAGTEGESKRIEAIQIRIIDTPKKLISYTTHVQNIGWQENVFDGEISGTEGKSLRLEAIKIKLENSLENAHIKYSTHIQNIGWQDWKYDGDLSGTTGQGLRLEAIRIKVEGCEKYRLEYRVHIQDVGWTEWMQNGETAGTEGQNKRLEAIEIRLVRNIDNEYIENLIADKEIHVIYNTHIQDLGWQNLVLDGDISGTEGKSKRLESLNIKAYNLPEGVEMSFIGHVQDYGWQDWKQNGETIGTTGEGKRLEALKIKLENTDKYSIIYRAHVENYGWQDWSYDGEMAGTVGEGKRVEAIQIKIVDKIKDKKTRLNFDELEKKITNATHKITGWCMTNVSNTKMQLLIDDILYTENFERTKDQSVYNQIKGYGGEELNPTPRATVYIDFSNYQLGEHALTMRVLDENENVIAERTQVINLVSRIVMQNGIYGISGLRVSNINNGFDLRYYQYGSGPNVFFATFCVHGFEDQWANDGTELVQIADRFWEYLQAYNGYDLAEKWTIYIFPEVNPDGRRAGWTNNGPGRTTLYTAAAKGIDLNRCWSSDFVPQYENRYYTGDEPFLAYEARYLRDFLLSHKSQNGQTILVDLHGWTQQLIGDKEIRGYYKNYFPENTDTASYGKGYLINWARNNLGSNSRTARSALIELPSYIRNHQDVINYNLTDKYINATLDMLRGIN